MLLVASWFDLVRRANSRYRFHANLEAPHLARSGLLFTRPWGSFIFFEGDVPDELQRLDFFGATKNQEMLGASMTNSLKFRVEASDEDDLIVTLDGTTHMVKYRKYDNQRGLKLFHVRGDATAPIHDIHFLARASQLANAKAKELGWFA